MGAIMNLLNLRNFVSKSFDLVAFLVDKESITLIISEEVDGVKKKEFLQDLSHGMRMLSLTENINSAIFGPIFAKCSFRPSAISSKQARISPSSVISSLGSVQDFVLILASSFTISI